MTLTTDWTKLTDNQTNDKPNPAYTNKMAHKRWVMHRQTDARTIKVVPTIHASAMFVHMLEVIIFCALFIAELHFKHLL